MAGERRETDGKNQLPGEVLFEVRRLGAVLRVAALDPVTNTEVVVSGPAATGEAPLIQLARRKLSWVLQRRPAGPGQ
jgi:hypothetical protein